MSYITNIRKLKYYDFNNKEKNVELYGQYMLMRTQSLFKWKNLPPTIPQRNLELLLQTNGHAFITKFKIRPEYDNLNTNGEEVPLAVSDSYGSYQNPYYEPIWYIVANPALVDEGQSRRRENKMYKINEDGVLVKNDSMLLGLMPLLSRYCSLLVENDISFRLANINSRKSEIIAANDDRTFKSALAYLKDLEQGKQGVIADNAFLESLNILNTGRSTLSNILTDLTEFHQYIKGSMYNEIGLDANYNMKRERLTSSEIKSNNDTLFPLVDDMLNMRKQACEQLNEMFGWNVSVDFDGAWKRNKEEEESDLEVTKANVDLIQAQVEAQEIANEQSEILDVENEDNTGTSVENQENATTSETSSSIEESSNDNTETSIDSDTNNFDTNNDKTNTNEQEESPNNENESYTENTDENMESNDASEIILDIENVENIVIIQENTSLDEQGETNEESKTDTESLDDRE